MVLMPPAAAPPPPAAPKKIEWKKRSDQEILEAAREDYKTAKEAWEKQRQREKEDLEFQVPELQWDADARRERDGDGDMIPPRPCLSISKIAQPIQLVVNQMRAADLGLTIHPLGKGANEDTAEIIKGLFQHDDRESQSENAREWAFDRAVKAGFGVWRVTTAYDETSDHPSDQKIVIQRIKDQSGVLFDPSAQEPDFSDGNYAFVLTWMSRTKFRKEYPKARGADSAISWADYLTEAPDWARDGKDILVAEYWYKEHQTEEVEYETGDVDEDGKPVTTTRKICHTRVCCAHIDGRDVLEHQEWMGPLIPLVALLGMELQPFDGERRYFGMTRMARDSQRLYNVSASTLVEEMGLQVKAPYIADPKQIEGYEQFWKQANTRNFPYLPFNAIIDGQVVPPPPRTQADGSKMSLAMMALQEADKFIQASTSVYDPSLGRETSRDKSGKAILALQQQTDAGTSHYMKNLQVAMKYEAKVRLSLLPYVYDRPGRIARVLHTDDNKTEAIVLNAPYVKDSRTGQPMRVPAPTATTKVHNLRDGVYAVSVKIGKSFQTRLDEGAAEIGAIVEARPELLQMIGDLYFMHRDFPGAKEIAERFAKMMPPQLKQGEDGQPSPDQLQAMNGQLQQQMQGMQQMIGMLQKEVETDRAKAEAALLKTRMEIESKERIAAADNETKLALAGFQTRIETLLTALEHAQATRARHEEFAHDVGLAAGGGRTMEMSTDQGQEQGGEMTDETSEGASSMPEPPMGGMP
jgi:portal protein